MSETTVRERAEAFVAERPHGVDATGLLIFATHEIARLESQLASTKRLLEAYENALTPSAETKGVFMGRFSWTDETGDYGVTTSVPWTVVKEIMAAIRQRALDHINKEQQEDRTAT